MRPPLAGRRSAARRLAEEVRRRLPGLGGGEAGDGPPRSKSAWAIPAADGGVVGSEQVAAAPDGPAAVAGEVVAAHEAEVAVSEIDPDGETVAEPRPPTPEELVARLDAARARLQATIKAPVEDGGDADATVDPAAESSSGD